MSEYGVFGSATYAVTLSGLDQLIDVLPDNNSEQIDAQVMRNVVYTLWVNGGGGGSFSYTQTAPFSQGSSERIGGIASGTTFSNVSLQDLFDRIFFPPAGTIYDITTAPSSLELGYGAGSTPAITPVTTVQVRITRKNPTIIQVNVTGPAGSLGNFGDISNWSYNEERTKTYSNVTVPQDTDTTFNLSIQGDSGTLPDSAFVKWYFPRFFGSIDINTLIGSDFNTNNLTSTQKTTIINRLKTNIVTGDADWSPVWQGISSTSFNKSASQLSTVSITPVSGPGAHFVLIWPKTDYGDGVPTSFQFGQLTGFPFLDLGEHSVQNQYGYNTNCRIWIKDFRTSGTTTFTINQ